MQNLVPVNFDPFGETKEIEKITLTNESQREIWLACVIGGNDANLAYNESISLRIKGALNFNAFKKSVNDLILRHEALRSTISPNGESFIIYTDCPTDFDLEDISQILNQDEFLKIFIKKQMDVPLDLSNGPLFKIYLHKLSEFEYHFTLIIHHAIGDGWSIGIILEDLSKLYNLYIQGKSNSLPKPAQISDFAIAQTEFQLTEEYKETEGFWINLYKDGAPIVDLPVDFARTSPRSHNGHRIDYPISKDFANQIKNVGAKSGNSFVTTLLAAFEIFLYLKTNNSDVVIGLPAAGQQSSGLYDLVGHCVNLLPIKSKIDPEASFTEYLKKRKGEVLDAYDYQRLTFGELIKKLYIPRDPSRVTLVPVIFNIDMGMDQSVSFDGLDYKLISNPRSYENFEVYLNITGSKEDFLLEWSYNTDLFKAETIKSFHKDYINILEKLVAEPNFIIGALNQKGLKLKNVKKISPPVYQQINETLVELFYKSAKLYQNETAVSFKDSGLTYNQLNEKSNQLAHFLINENVNPKDNIVISAERSLDMIVSLLAIIKTGSAYVPIDSAYPKDRIGQIVKNTAPKCILVSRKLADKFVDFPDKVFIIEDILEASKSQEKENLTIKTEKLDLIYILHTSGSTGVPKGVCMNQNALVNLLLWQKAHSIATVKTKTLQFSPISFDVSFQEIFATLTNGGNLVLISEDERIDPFKLLDILTEQKINRLFLPFVALQSITESAATTHIYPTELKEVMTAGEQLKVTPQIIKFFSRIPGSVLYNQYGPTEAHVVTEYKLEGNPEKWPNLPSIGTAIDNTTIYILDENLNEVQDGEVGELCIGGLCLANGYLNLPDLTEEKFTTIPGTQIRIYRTGDLAKFLPNGNIEFLGRSDHQVKIRGYRIELGEIEAHLNKQSGIKQAVVHAIEDKSGNKKLIAYLTVDTSVAITKLADAEDNEKFTSIIANSQNNEVINVWKNELKESLPEYMVPNDLVILNRIPLTSTGKIDRKSLPAITLSAVNDIADYVEPRTSSERLISEIWTDILNIEKISIKSDFFELGGHSLLAVKVMMAIEKVTQRRLPLSTLFENSTIERLAKMIVIDEEEIKWNSLVPIKKTGNRIPIYLIHGGGLNVLVFNSLGKYMDAEQPVYGMQALGLNGKTELLYSMEELADRYNSEIINNDPIGPYAIAGYSFGGLLAYEMAKRLIAIGKEVKMIGILDTNAAGRDYESTKLKRAVRKIFRQFSKLLFFSKSFLVNPAEVYNYQKKSIKYKINSIFGSKPYLEEEIFSYEKEILNSYNIAYENYVMKPHNVKIDLFRVKERIYFLDDPVYLGWKDYAQKGVNVHEVPGDHKTFLLPPNDKALAEILQKALDGKE